MAYIQLISFVLAVAWIILRGYKAKSEYLRRKTEEEPPKGYPQTFPDAIGDSRTNQGNGRQLAELTGALAGYPEKRVHGFGQGRG